MNTHSRRNAIKTMALGSSLALVNPLNLLARSKKEKIGVALVGLGYYSTDLLAPALQQTEHCYLAGIVTGTPSKAVAWKEKYQLPDKNIYNYENFDSIANNPDIDVVYVVLPPSMHAEYTIRAANAGKHVWCEKPMAVTSKECQDMIDACEKNKVQLTIGYRLQHEPNTQEYRSIVRQNKLGKVNYVNCAAGYRENRTDHWKQKKEMGGGVIYDMGVYSIQGARMGTNMEPVSVISATALSTRPEIYQDGLADVVEAKLEFPGGVRADIKTSFAENINFLTIECEEGDIEMQPYSAYAGVKGKSPLGEINHPYQVPWQQANQMDDDALAILENKAPLVPGEEGLRDIKIVEAILKSAENGRSVKV
ncbi:Gfo/Idh/MocA family protein [Cyclobacterium jeungdonense]|uniref:Gfo/Idh/MocA family oxidoreductase n=1 Tax=Cyclobacterium jeungdonense TaxID=708087 RepID=A0ABT8C9F8_9BACT|nr:Gfo/Idh/MocA family oxidoreductase [Cyclobacterium jeungdonense]MDN3688273.1 Gfo/Idh/MocA family oxidoreductase [Cyclobacterium jeungdonense]